MLALTVCSTVLPCFFSLGQADDSDLVSSSHVEPCPSYGLKLIIPLLARLPYFCRSLLILSRFIHVPIFYTHGEFWYGRYVQGCD